MRQLILVSILLISIIAPVVAAREQNPRIALRKALTWTLIGILLYLLAVVFIYPRLDP